jgi:hypothetical protein
MTRKLSALMFTAAASLAMSGVAAADDDKTVTLRTELRGAHEVPVTITGAAGRFRARLADDGESFEYWLDYANLEGTVTQAHIHIGQAFAAGGISVWLCKTAAAPGPANLPADTPVCAAPGGDGPEATGVISAEDVLGPTGQAIPVGDFVDLLRAIFTGNAYVNVHSTSAPGGEIRGQIDRSRRGHDHD